MSKVFVNVTIDTGGKVSKIKLIRGFNPDYDKEAIRIIELMPPWIPATENGKKIPQIWNLPIIFDIEKKEKHCP